MEPRQTSQKFLPDNSLTSVEFPNIFRHSGQVAALKTEINCAETDIDKNTASVRISLSHNKSKPNKKTNGT